MSQQTVSKKVVFCALLLGWNAFSSLAHAQNAEEPPLPPAAPAERSQPAGALPPASGESERAMQSFSSWRLGGYGEMAASYHDFDQNRFTPSGAAPTRRGTIGIPRVVIAADHKFSPEWILSVELEIEQGGTGISREIEWAEEGGEYEMSVEKGGKVGLEQFRLTRLIHPAFNVRVGHLIVPVGRINSRHAPTQFFTVYRPESETAILPSTWHENGLAFFGAWQHFEYQVMVVAGLDPHGFRDRDWIRNGKQGAFETDTFTSPAFVARVNYTGVPGLLVGLSGYFNQSAKNASKPQRTAELDATVSIATAELQYQDHHIVFRASGIYGHLSDSAALSTINKRLPGSSGYSNTPVAKTALSYGAELGYNVGSLLGADAPQVLPFIRYEYYNPMASTEGSILADKRFEVAMWSAGINYFALPDLVVKADYASRRIGGGNYNNENTLSVGLAYAGWFFKK